MTAITPLSPATLALIDMARRRCIDRLVGSVAEIEGENDKARLHELAHRIRGTAGSFGLTDVEAAAAALEQGRGDVYLLKQALVVAIDDLKS